MKRQLDSDQRIEEFVDRTLAPFLNVPHEEAHAACDRVLSRLQLESEDALSDVDVDLAPAPPAWRWRRPGFAVAVVAAIALIAVLLQLPRPAVYAVIEIADGGIYRTVGGDLLRAGQRIEAGEVVRTNGGTGSVLRLPDSSTIEMRSKTQLFLERADDGVRIRLSNGGVIVNAAKQKPGSHLYVRTKDMTVSVVGTVFLVNAEEGGSRVAVIEGEVRVQQGTEEKRLLPGEQVTTSPKMELLPVQEEIVWSREAETHVALLQQAAATRPKPRIAFEEVSIRMREGSGRGGGLRGEAQGLDAIPGGPCEAIGPHQLDPRRLLVTRAGLLWIITAAYRLGGDVSCRSAVAQKLLSQGPDWVRTTEFDVEALLPPGTPDYTIRQLETGGAPEIQKMLQTMLAERFKLVVKREAREMPGYILSVAPSGAKLTPSKGGFAIASGTREFPDCSNLPITASGLPNTENINRCRRYNYGTGTIFAAVEGMGVSMDQLAGRLQLMTQRPVINRTGISGDFDLDLIFAPTLPDFATGVASRVARGLGPILSSPSLSKALEDQMGLLLESSQAPVETFVIVSVEKPSEN